MESVFKDNILKGKVALITGGASGIGFGISQLFGVQGAKIVLMGRRVNVLEEAVNKLKERGVESIGLEGSVQNPKNQFPKIFTFFFLNQRKEM